MKKIFLFAAATLALTACSSNDDPEINGGKPIAARVTANIDVPVSRAYDQTWENGDAIGISTTSTGKTQYANMHYTTSGNGNFTHVGGDASGIFFQNTDEVTFSAYYPFKGEENKATEIIDDVTTENQKNQKTFDFLFASDATASRASSTLSFAFKHKMTRLILQLQTDANSGFTGEEDLKDGPYKLNGIKHNGTFDTATGKAVATGEANADWEITAQATDNNNVRTYSMIFYPQSNAKLTLKATINGETYTCDIATNLVSGMSYTYTITVKKAGLVVSGCTIDSWGEGGNNTGDATM